MNSISQTRKHSLCTILLGISRFISSMSLWTLMLKLILIFFNELHLNIKGNLNDYALLQSANCFVVLFLFYQDQKGNHIGKYIINRFNVFPNYFFLVREKGSILHPLLFKHDTCSLAHRWLKTAMLALYLLAYEMYEWDRCCPLRITELARRCLDVYF